MIWRLIGLAAVWMTHRTISINDLAASGGKSASERLNRMAASRGIELFFHFRPDYLV
jgi:hypothetical protein